LNDLINSGIGIDLVQIKRFKQLSFSENQSFYKKNFSEDEINYCLKFNEPYKHFAGKFALKEALIKSIDKKISLSKIETSHLDSKPIVKILGNNENYRFRASVSHENEFAVAIVISEKLR
jgi:holo-[acyl-carrier protein] synthase